MRAAITRRARNARFAPRATRAASTAYPNVDIEAKAVYTNNPNAGAMRGFGSNQAQFALEGVMDMLAERVGVDGWDIRERNILNPGDAYCTGQIMRESVRGGRATLDAVKDVYKSAKYKGIGCGIKSTGLGNGTIEGGYIKIRVVEGGRLEILNGYTEMGQGVYTATMQAVCEETGLPAEHHDGRLGRGARREVRRDVGVAGNDVELRRRAGGRAEAGRRSRRLPNEAVGATRP